VQKFTSRFRGNGNNGGACKRGESLIGVAAAQFGVGSYGEVALVACSQSAVAVQDR